MTFDSGVTQAWDPAVAVLTVYSCYFQSFSVFGLCLSLSLSAHLLIIRNNLPDIPTTGQLRHSQFVNFYALSLNDSLLAKFKRCPVFASAALPVFVMSCLLN